MREKEIILTRIVDLVAPQTSFQAWSLIDQQTYRSFLVLDISRLFSKKFKAQIAEFFTPWIYSKCIHNKKDYF